MTALRCSFCNRTAGEVERIVSGPNPARPVHICNDCVRVCVGCGTALTLADCLIDLGRLGEALKYLAEIDVKAVSQLTGDPGCRYYPRSS
jgi:ClpX C4-type zinc finger